MPVPRSPYSDPRLHQSLNLYGKVHFAFTQWPFNIVAVRPLDKVDDIPYIDVVATKTNDGKFITPISVNRSLEEDVPTKFDLGTLTPKDPDRCVRSNRAAGMNGTTRSNRNTWSGRKFAGRNSDRPVSVSLPHESVGVIRSRSSNHPNRWFFGQPLSHVFFYVSY